MHKIISILVFVLSIHAPIASSEDMILEYVPNAQRVGDGRLSFLFWDLYEITLYAPSGNWENIKPFAIELSYLREIDAQKLADSSIAEIRRQGIHNELTLATWHNQISHILPNVSAGVTLVGIYTEKGETVFMKDGLVIGTISDEAFSKAFFDIWLGEKTKSPNLRSQLLGIK